MEIINVNEAQFLSSLKQGRSVIDRTLNKMDRNAVEFPGKKKKKKTRTHLCVSVRFWTLHSD